MIGPKEAGNSIRVLAKGFQERTFIWGRAYRRQATGCSRVLVLNQQQGVGLGFDR
jgi:hypothetical protein